MATVPRIPSHVNVTRSRLRDGTGLSWWSNLKPGSDFMLFSSPEARTTLRVGHFLFMKIAVLGNARAMKLTTTIRGHRTGSIRSFCQPGCPSPSAAPPSNVANQFALSLFCVCVVRVELISNSVVKMAVITRVSYVTTDGSGLGLGLGAGRYSTTVPPTSIPVPNQNHGLVRKRNGVTSSET